MKSRPFVTRLAVLCLAASTVFPAYAAKKGEGASTEPGSYKKWGPDIDEIEIVKKFELSSYKNVVVVPMETGDTPLPPKDENTYEPVVKILGTATEAFVEGLQKNTEAKVSVDAKPGKGAGTLIVRTKVEMMDPGSRAKRYWAGFGAGAARTKISGELVDAKTKEVLVRFSQERRSGFGMGGGSYEAVMTKNLRALGSDVAAILNQF
jgi:hypothetical protein